MASLTAGYVFGATETVTNTKLGTLVTGGGVTSITQTDITAAEGLVHTGTAAPSDTDQLWVDTNSTPPHLRAYNSTVSLWVPVGEMALMTNKSAQTGSAGRVLVLDTTNPNSYKYTSTAGDTSFVGIETGSIAANASASVVSHALGITVLLDVSASAGCYIRTTTATGKAEQCVKTAAGIFGMLTEAGTASARAYVFGIQPNQASVDQTASYTWTGAHSFTSTITINTASGTTTNWVPYVQTVRTIVTTTAASATTIPADNSIPTTAEGTQYISASITPKHSANRLIIEWLVHGSRNAAGGIITTALFQDSGANAIAVAAQGQNAADIITHVRGIHEMSAGTTAATKFRIYAGGDAGTFTFNGVAGAGYYNGVLNSSLIIYELKT